MEKHVSRRKAFKKAVAKRWGISVNEFAWVMGGLRFLSLFSSRLVPGVPLVPKPQTKPVESNSRRWYFTPPPFG